MWWKSKKKNKSHHEEKSEGDVHQKSAKDLILEYHSLGYTNKKIRELTKKESDYIWRVLSENGLKSNPYVKICKNCGKSFKSKIINKHYCSYKCRDIYHKKHYTKPSRKLKYPKTYERKCPTCGSSFKTKVHNKKYCSEKCRLKSHKKVDVAKKINNENDLILILQNDYLRLKEINPVEAQKIADKMRKIEGEEFTDLVLNGFVKKKNDRKMSPR